MKLPDLYTKYANWWTLLSPPEEYAEDAAAYMKILQAICRNKPRNVLELGSGGGNNASYMKQHFKMTLCDISKKMLLVSRKLNPECEHIHGDMRSVRLDREFDAVFIHDAIVYMRSLRDLRRAIKTAYIHCREGGGVLFTPDYTKETFHTGAYHGGYDGKKRSMRYLQWDRDPDPEDSTYRIDFAYMFCSASGRVKVEHETHTCGLFSIEEWYQAISDAGFEAGSVTIETDQLEPGFYRVFTGRKK